MSHTVKITKLLESVRHVTFHVYVKSDGVSGDISDQVLLSVADLTPPLSQKPTLCLEEAWYDLSGFSVRLEFNDAVDTPVWTLSHGNGPYIDFRCFGGLQDRSGLDGNGSLLFSTTGLDAAAKQGTFVVKVRKT